MSSNRPISQLFRLYFGWWLLLISLTTTGQAQTLLYWDTNGAAPGSSAGTTAPGIWDTTTSANWTTDAAGTTATSTWSAIGSGNQPDVIFAAGTNATGAYTVTVNGAIDSINNITFKEGSVTLTGGTLVLESTSTINVLAAQATIASTITGGGFGVTKVGTGTLNVSGTNTYSGTTSIQAGTLSVNMLANTGLNSALGAPTTLATGTIAIGATTTGATLAYTGTGNNTNRVIDLAGTTGGATLDSSGTGAIVFTSNFTATGAGSKTLTLTGSSSAANTISGAIVNNSGANTTSLVKSGAGTWVLSGANTFTGPTTINGGMLSIDADNRLGTAPVAATANQLVFNGGTLNTTASFVLNVNRGTTLSAGGGTINVNAGTTLSYGGTITGTGTLIKSGTGTLALLSSIVLSGELQLNAGTLALSGYNLTAATLHITGNSTIDFAGGISTLRATNFVIDTGVTLTIKNWLNAADYFYTQGWTGASFNASGSAPMNQVMFTGYNASNTRWQSSDFQITPVPEPSTYGALLLAGLGTFAGFRRYRRSRHGA